MNNFIFKSVLTLLNVYILESERNKGAILVL